MNITTVRFVVYALILSYAVAELLKLMIVFAVPAICFYGVICGVFGISFLASRYIDKRFVRSSNEDLQAQPVV